MLKENTLNDDVILITGGGSGLGLAMAKKFASLGAHIAICGRTEEKLKNAVTEISSEKDNSQVEYYVQDVRDYEGVAGMMDNIWDDFGQINGLVNNAAGNFLSAAEDLTPGGFKAVVDIVLHGSFNCAHSFGKKAIEAENGGSILNIVTTYTETGSGYVLPSASAKAGVLAMGNTLAYEWAGFGIRVNAIAPGPFPTEGAWSRLVPDDKAEQQFLSKIPMGRYGDHEELANLAAFLMSDMSPYITGECVTIDGGEHLKSGQFNFLDEMVPRSKLRQLFQTMKPDK